MTCALDLGLALAAPLSQSTCESELSGQCRQAAQQWNSKSRNSSAGIGLARLGLEKAQNATFKVTWANDFAPDKQGMYTGNFVDTEMYYHVRKIRKVANNIKAVRLPTSLSLAWASFPCTDLSSQAVDRAWPVCARAPFGNRPPIVAIDASSKP
ncbi:DNA cytosine methyltransferase [Nocardia sp. KC 131]|uniref:DNA cytosine methyltransferase n=1 Tax=Nocardia arseniciresistens TaxID=3392119 RepID=UPI00398F0064